MADPHPFVAGPNDRCAATPDGDITRPCGRGRAANIHTAEPIEPRLMHAPAEAVGRVRSLPAGRRKVPWSELPAPSKAAALVIGAACAALLVCVVATLCRLILSAGGWFG